MSEEGLQKAVVSMLRLYAPADVIWFHPPNGEHRAKRTAARLKAMGVRAGVADLVIVSADGTLFLELKDGVKGRPSPAQRRFAADCEAAGIPYAIARDPEQAASILHGWGALKENPLGRSHEDAAA